MCHHVLSRVYGEKKEEKNNLLWFFSPFFLNYFVVHVFFLFCFLLCYVLFCFVIFLEATNQLLKLLILQESPESSLNIYKRKINLKNVKCCKIKTKYLLYKNKIGRTDPFLSMKPMTTIEINQHSNMVISTKMAKSTRVYIALNIYVRMYDPDK